ncbi:hypothetical protein diail_5420, partial [Diaporthe ilicicola]
ERKAPLDVTPKAESQDATRPAIASGPTAAPPDWGLKAWLQVLGAFFLFFNS